MLVADDGIAMWLTLRNDSDRDIRVDIGNWTANGLDSSYQVSKDYAVAAGSRCVSCIHIMLENGLAEEIGAVSEITMDFRMDDGAALPAVIRLNAPVALGQSGGAYLTREDFETVPAVQTLP